MVLTGLIELMSPVFVAVSTVLFALVMVTPANVSGLLFLGNDNVEGADKTHTGGVGEASADTDGDGEGDVPGDGLGSTEGSGDGPAVGEGAGSPSGEGDGDVSGDGLGLACGSLPSIGVAPGVPDTSVDGVELSVISPISLSWKLSLPIVTSPPPERCMVLG